MDNGNADDDWFQALAGRGGAGHDPGAELEARLLRAAIRQQAQRRAAEPLSPADLQALAHDAPTPAGAAPRRWGCSGCAGRWRALLAAPRWLAASAAGLAIALLAGVGVALWMQAQQRPDAEVLRGPSSAGQGVQLLRASDPAAAREALAARLLASGARITRHERLGRFGLQADWPAPPSAAAQAELARLGLSVAAGQPLLVEFERAAP